MSYVRPAFDAVTASWDGEAAYTRPSSDAVAAQWVVQYSAAGINSTTFGTAAYLEAAPQTGTASGFAGTQFGAHASLFTNGAASVPVSVFGAPSVELTAVGFTSAGFGTPEGASFLRASRVSSKSYFGTPLALFVDRTCEASGFVSSLGAPYAGLFSPAQYNQISKAGSVLPVAFGQPSSPVEQQGSAAPFISTRFGRPSKGVAPLSAFGTHRALFSYQAQALPAASFGEHAVEMTYRAGSTTATAFGEPSAQRVERASAMNRTRFGMPTSDMTGVHRSYGFRRSWFGNHRALRDISAASGWEASSFGEPACTEIHRALHIPPEHKFGTHLLKRGA